MKYKIFVDGQFGTTGLKIHEMLASREELEILTISEDDKKDIEVKKRLLNEADLVFLCLPDVASKESVALITNENTKVIDASTAHRTNPEWTYGIAELTPTQREKIKNSKRVCVPGCHASGFIMAMKPLIENDVVSKSQKIVCHSITGYSGGGKGLIDTYEAVENKGKFDSQRPYALGLSHKHLPEMKHTLGLKFAPFFTPSVGNFAQGMLVMSYLVKSELLNKKITKKEVLDLYKEYYKGEQFVKIIEDDIEYLDDGFLDAMKCNNTNRIEISVYESEDYMLVISRLDNLGKGASGAAVQNMNIMLGLDEKLGLQA
jgi:N-acetyl-gamma-glutamyl-phosphate reductase